MLVVKNLHVAVDGKDILRGIDLEVAAGEVHAIMVPSPLEVSRAMFFLLCGSTFSSRIMPGLLSGLIAPPLVY